jgi:uncharacterized membrane protein YdjX (TVP38/TMEM64 family)
MDPTNHATKKPPLRARLIVLLLIVAVGAVLVFCWGDIRMQLGRGLELVRTAGPGCFFTAMALLPALPVPIIPFLLTAGPAFSEQLGLLGVIAFSLLAMTINFTFTYWLARRGIRPLVQALMIKFGYRLPEVKEGDSTDLAIIVRVTPGIPFFVQNYLLGLANVPFGRYFLISCLFNWGTSTAFVLFGDALLRGRGKMVLLAFSLLAAATAITHLARRHYRRAGTLS